MDIRNIWNEAMNPEYVRLFCLFLLCFICLVILLSFAVRAIGALFSKKLRSYIITHPVLHILWLIISLMILLFILFAVVISKPD